MPKNLKTLVSGGSTSEHRGNARSTYTCGTGGSRKSKAVHGSTISERVIQQTSVKRRTAMKALADR